MFHRACVAYTEFSSSLASYKSVIQWIDNHVAFIDNKMEVSYLGFNKLAKKVLDMVTSFPLPSSMVYSPLKVDSICKEVGYKQ